MKDILATLILLLTCNSLAAATITVEACAEFDVIQASAPDVINSVPETCINIDVDADPELSDGTISRSDFRNRGFAYGGCNTSGADVTYTAERRIRYSITEQSFPPDERTRAKVTFSWLQDTFTSGEGSISQTIDSAISDGVCVDAFGNFSAFAEASTGLVPGLLTNETGINGLFYDPDNPGHGLNFIRSSAGLTAYYYGHTAEGERLWLVSNLHTDRLFYGLPFGLEMFEVTDGAFGTPVLPETTWGTMTILLQDCDSGSASLNGADGQLQFNFERLAGLEHEDCY